MGIITKARTRGQKAVYWERDCSGPDEFGSDTYLAPIELEVRWDDKMQKVVNSEGDEVISSAQVMVDRDCRHGKLKKATLDSLTDHDPEENEDVFDVLGMEIIPNFRNTETLYIAML
jgi:hypothetical protein